MFDIQVLLLEETECTSLTEAVMCDVLRFGSAAVQQCLMTSSVWEAIRAVDNMAALDAGLNQSGCSHLKDFLRETLHFWHKIIKDRLAR